MKILDTDILTLFFHGHRRVVANHQQESDEVAVTMSRVSKSFKGASPCY
jgi:hypothetical protein